MFNFKLTIGDEDSIIDDYEAIILSEEFSKKLFGDTDPIGKEVFFEASIYQGLHVVKGIIKVPSNSSIKFDVVLPNIDGVLYGAQHGEFVKLNKGIRQREFDEKIKHSNNNVPNVYPPLTETFTKTVKLNDLYFSKDFNRIKELPIFISGNRDNINILIIFIIAILLVSILNFSNLQIVNLNAVIKNIVISKINGAFKKNIYHQKLIENFLIIAISAIIITVIYNLAIPYFSGFMNTNLRPPVVNIISLNVLFLTLITGIGLIYPLININRLSSVLNVNKHQQLKGKQIIVVIQYTLAIVLIIASIIVSKQLQLMLNKNLGFNTKNIMRVKPYSETINVPVVDSENEKQLIADREKILDKSEYVKNQLASFPGVKKVGLGRSPLEIYQIEWKTKQETSSFETFNTLMISAECQDIFGFELLEGRLFDKDIDRVRGTEVLINEAAKNHWGIKDISATILDNIYWGQNFEIIGVLKDFNYEHLASKPKPLFIVNSSRASGSYYFIQFHNNKNQEAIAQIEQLFKTINPNQPFRYGFLSDDVAALYDKEKRLSIIYISFSIIALLISAIGLFTIALYDTQRRIKEIGVRKVNGATIKDILIMLNRDFMKWVFVAFVIACPIAYFAMTKWLENFAYKTPLSWWVFLLAGTFTFIIALLTVSLQSYQAATQNPVDSLRDE
jgi:putative ABC transport system permease protein